MRGSYGSGEAVVPTPNEPSIPHSAGQLILNSVTIFKDRYLIIYTK